MDPTTALGVFVLFLALGFGTVAHELSHALALQVFGIPYRIDWRPEQTGTGPLRTVCSGPLATVTPTEVSGSDETTALRIAALMPLTLLLPCVLLGSGVLPDPFQITTVPVEFAVVGWLACALPSPRDFSLLWHAHRLTPDRPSPRHRDEATKGLY